MSSDQLIERWCKDHATPATVQWLVDNFEPAEGNSIRRSILYNFYLEHCLGLKVEPLNPASFGKLIHSVFLGLKTRRLGTRGNSKYHYYGIRVKSSSPLIKQMPFDGDLLTSNPNSNIDLDSASIDSQPPPINMSPNDYVSDMYFSSNELLPITVDQQSTLSEVTADDLKLFQKTHDEYCGKLYQAIVKFQFAYIEILINNFWSLTNVHLIESKFEDHTGIFTSDHFLGQQNVFPWKFSRICTLPFIINQLRLFYSKFYQTIIDTFFPDILTSMTQSMEEAIRTIANYVPHWLIHAIEHLNQTLKYHLIQFVQAFSSILFRYTSLNHLSFTVQTMLIQPARLLTMSTDLIHIDFHDLHEQIHWLVECDLDLFGKIEQCLKNILQYPTTTTDNWTTLLETLLFDCLAAFEGTNEYVAAARKFLLKSNFYCSLIIRELTLHFGTSLGSFHLLQIFLEEFLQYRIEQKISFSLNQNVLTMVVNNNNNNNQPRTATINNLNRNNSFSENEFLFEDFLDEEIDDDDDDDDLESLPDDLIDRKSLNETNHSNGYFLKPLSPVIFDDLLQQQQQQPTSTTETLSFFEDLQPFTNEIF